MASSEPTPQASDIDQLIERARKNIARLEAAQQTGRPVWEETSPAYLQKQLRRSWGWSTVLATLLLGVGAIYYSASKEYKRRIAELERQLAQLHEANSRVKHAQALQPAGVQANVQQKGWFGSWFSSDVKQREEQPSQQGSSRRTQEAAAEPVKAKHSTSII